MIIKNEVVGGPESNRFGAFLGLPAFTTHRA